jgi:hypothetical protein
MIPIRRLHLCGLAAAEAFWVLVRHPHLFPKAGALGWSTFHPKKS